MKKFTVLLTASTLLAGFGLSAADDTRDNRHQRVQTEQRAARIDIDRRIQAINRLDNRGAALRQGLTAVSKETAVPLTTLEEAHKQHPNAGIGALLIAQEIAVRTQKSVADILRLHSDGKSWSEIAKDHNSDLAALEQKLDRVEKAMQDAPK